MQVQQVTVIQEKCMSEDDFVPAAFSHTHFERAFGQPFLSISVLNRRFESLKTFGQNALKLGTGELVSIFSSSLPLGKAVTFPGEAVM